MRDAFAVLFFVSVGMLFDPAFLLDSPGLVLITLSIILLGKPLAALLLVRFLGYPVRTALAVSVVAGGIRGVFLYPGCLGQAARPVAPGGDAGTGRGGHRLD